MISVLINVYYRERPEHFHTALQSLYDQTFQDFEVVLVVDGPVPEELEKVIEYWKSRFEGRINIVRLPKNLGIAGAINAGLRECRTELVAKMDSDDFSLPHRFETQYRFMRAHPEIHVLGTQMGEFEFDPQQVVTIRRVPLIHEEITKLMWLKCPINHVTVMYRRSAILAVGGYDPTYGNDDFLWVKMHRAGYRFHNLDQCLVQARVGRNMKEMIRRRSTLELFRWNCKIRIYLFRHRMISAGHFIAGLFVACMILLLPLNIKSYFFRRTREQVA